MSFYLQVQQLKDSRPSNVITVTVPFLIGEPFRNMREQSIKVDITHVVYVVICSKTENMGGLMSSTSTNGMNLGLSATYAVKSFGTHIV